MGAVNSSPLMTECGLQPVLRPARNLQWLFAVTACAGCNGNPVEKRESRATQYHDNVYDRAVYDTELPCSRMIRRSPARNDSNANGSRFTVLCHRQVLSDGSTA